VAVMIVGAGGWSEGGGPDSGGGATRGVSFADGLVGPVGGACTGECGGTTGASGTASAGVAGTAGGVVDKHASALVSASAAFSRYQRLGNAAWRSVMPASGDMS